MGSGELTTSSRVVAQQIKGPGRWSVPNTAAERALRKAAQAADRASYRAELRRQSMLEAAENPPIDLSFCMSTILLAGATIVIACNSEFLVDSIDSVSNDYHLPRAFIGIILIPIAGNAAEHFTAVSAAYKGKMDLTIGIAVGSSSQVALFVVPFSVIIGWFYDQPMTLCFRGFDTGMLLLSVFLVSAVLQDGSANWLEGLMLLVTYLMVAVISCFIKEVE